MKPSRRWRFLINLAAGQALALSVIIEGLSGRRDIK